jgi:short-subunit dehydrogenase
MKRIVVFGATSAMAQQCCRLWAARGEALFLVARDPDRVSVISQDLRVRGAPVVASEVLDLTLLDRHASVFSNASRALGGIDIVFIAHGSLPDQTACERSVEKTLEAIQTNGLSVISLLTLAGDFLAQQGFGTIAVISSVAGDRGRASNYVYGSSKALVTAFAEGLRQQLFRSHVAVVTIKPGFVDTPMTAQFNKGLLWSKPEAVAIKMVQAIDARKPEVYIPAFWWLIMTVIRLIPHALFCRLKL